MRGRHHALFILLLRPATIALALALASCSSKAQPPTETSGNTTPQQGSTPGTPDAGGGTTPSTCGFLSTAAPFALPAITGAPTTPFAAMTGSIACATGTAKLTYTLADLDADGALDLVVTSACDDATIGVTAWLVYPGSAAGFAATATRYTIPPASPAGCAVVSLFDANGDLLPDYVVTSLCNDATVGSSRWLVYPNVKNGFASAATSYALPPGMSPGAFAGTGAATATCASASGTNDPAFALFDINGDGKLDFVVTQACDADAIGTNAWRVYLGVAAGASQAPTTFTLPSNPTYTAGAFASTSGTLSCSASASKPQFGLLDFDADGKLDLVVTQSCNDPSVGTNVWLLFHNTGTGFGASASLALPDMAGLPTDSFPSLGAAGTCAAGVGAPTYAILDADGDARPDLLVTHDCADALTGVSYWQLFTNTGTGFAPAFRAFTLPSALGATSAAPVGLTGSSQCATAPTHPAFTTAYLAGLTLDVVVTTGCADATVGRTQWLLYPASCK